MLSALLKPDTVTVAMDANYRQAYYSVPRARQHAPGVLIADDFNEAKLDASTWRIWQQDAGLTVEQKEGELVISGRTGKARGAAPEAGHRFTGIVSQKRFAPPDAVLLAKLKVPGGLKAAAGLERYMVHFCGAVPDYYTELVLGRERDGRRGWWVLSSSQYERAADLTPVAVETWNPGEPQLVKIEYDSAAQVSRAWMRGGNGEWRLIGEPQQLFLSAVQVELKVNIPQNGVETEARFDDCRLYRKPESAPVKILVHKLPSPGYVFPGVTVSLYRDDGVTLAGKGVTDRNGTVSLQLSSREIYPMGGWIHLEWNGQDLGRARVPAAGVQGIYPGDLWVVNAPARFTGSPMKRP